MKFKTQKEKRAFRMGCVVGKKQVIGKKNNRTKPRKSAVNKSAVKTAQSKPIRKHSTYNAFDDFDYTENGHIKGGYTVDGFFEPD